MTHQNSRAPHPNPQSRNENTDITRLKIQINRVLTSESFVDEFKTFQRTLGQALLVQEDIHLKLRMMDNLITYIEKQALDSDKSLAIIAFLKRCQERVQRPFSTELTGRIEVLKIEYNSMNTTPHEQFKLKFLQRYQNYIVSHPELSYKDCLRKISKQLHPKNEEVYLSKKSGLFVKHRFNDLIGDIVNDASDAALNISQYKNKNPPTSGISMTK